MSLKLNVTANYVSQIYVTGVGILVLPLYLQYMGAEAYGLVGFFTMLQAWFGFLDMGLTPTIGRETARYKGGSMSALAYRQLFRALSVIFTAIAIIGGGAIWLASELIASNWLNASDLAPEEVVLAVQIMAFSVALRWMGGLYRGVLTGSERLIWLSSFNVLTATLRFIAVFGTMMVYGFTPVVFLLHQSMVAILELTGLFLMSQLLLPSRNEVNNDIGWSFKPVKPVLKFSLAIAVTSSVWVLVTQTDKLILSGILPLAEYGYFTMAVLVASGIMLISMPISVAIMPRLAKLHAQSKFEEMICLYRNATQFVTVIAGSAALTIVFSARPLLYAWTGDIKLAKQAAPILSLYAIGYGFLAVSAFPYYLQYAKGNLRYHLIGNIAMVLILIPMSIGAAIVYGGVGAGYVWAAVNALYLLAWVPYVHRKLQPGLHWPWFLKDIAIIAIPTALVLAGFSLTKSIPADRLLALFDLVQFSVLSLLVAALSSPMIRRALTKMVRFNR